MSDANEDLQQQLQSALESDDLPGVYFNSFINTLANGDVAIVLKRNNRPIAVLNASYTVAKSFGLKLTELIQILETKTDHVIMTTDDINAAMQKEEADEGNDNGEE